MTTRADYKVCTSGRAQTGSRLLGNRLLWMAGGSFLLYFVLFLLLGARSFRLTKTLTLYNLPGLMRLWKALTPAEMATSSWRTPQAGVHEIVYAATALGLIALWVASLWYARRRQLGLGWILGAIVLFGVPLILLPGMFSGDLYLYMFYGRIIATYGHNPLLYAPDYFARDPHLNWIYWSWLPSAYGPVWLMLSGALSAIGGGALLSNILAYKGAALLLHIATTGVIWRMLRDSRPELATWGAICYGWNPLVLHETVGSGHNEVMIAMFLALALFAVSYDRWLYAVFFVTAAGMVKITAFMFLPLLLLAWLATLPSVRRQVEAVARAMFVAIISAVALYAPLWAGPAIIRNSLDNPANQRYLNSVWELIINHTPSPPGTVVLTQGHTYLNLLRNGLFVIVYLFILWKVWKGWTFSEAGFWSWLVYCLTLAWIWPWYFVVLVPFAAVRGSSRLSAITVALTVGGLLFWMGWPDPPIPAAPWLYYGRSILLFGPALIVLAWPWLSARVAGLMSRELGPA